MPTVYYPQNYPLRLENALIDLLYRLQENSNRIKSVNDLKKEVRMQLRNRSLQIKFGSRTPPFWWINFTLLRHEGKFNPGFIKNIRTFLTKTETRSLSGIVPLSLFTSGTGCPFNCIYCPNEPRIPKSYFSDEPAVMRAIRHGFDPYKQTLYRLIMLALSNHPTDKVEIIIKGGTFSFYEKRYREWFVKRIFDACNTDVLKLLKTGFSEDPKSPTLESAQQKNENAASRIVGINIETRPDFISFDELLFLRRLGVTHVEIGVQMPDDKLYRLIRRGHTVRQVQEATKSLKNAGFKVGFHLMPNLPGSSAQKDLMIMRNVFSDKRYRPDHLKLYPTTVTSHTILNEWFKKGRYTPYSFRKLLEVIVGFKSGIVPPWVRIGRLTRDITTNTMTMKQFPPNFRETVQKEMKKKDLSCRCIRCREIRSTIPVRPIRCRIIRYQASGGDEYFIEYIDAKKHSLAFLRLRIADCSDGVLPGLENTAIIRELHVYGHAVPIGVHEKNKIQHMNLGKKLLQKAESVSKKRGICAIAVIAGVGTREYYRKLGYSLQNTYMVKRV